MEGERDEVGEKAKHSNSWQRTDFQNHPQFVILKQKPIAHRLVSKLSLWELSTVFLDVKEKARYHRKHEGNKIPHAPTHFFFSLVSWTSHIPSSVNEISDSNAYHSYLPK